MERIYADYAATTPCDSRVIDAMISFNSYEKQGFGNPSSLHSFGQVALTAVDYARERCAQAITAHRDEIVFTGCATEANNLALSGTVAQFKKRNKDTAIPHLVISSIEHASVLTTALQLEKDGLAHVSFIPVTKNGVVDVGAMEKMITPKTVLVSCMAVNNETGVIQPIERIAAFLVAYKKQEKTIWPLFHTDAVQALSVLDVNVMRWGVDLATFSAHKAYGPKGVGMLFVRNDIRNAISPLIVGGDQEMGMRAGTENVSGIVGFGEAAHWCVHAYRKDAEKIKNLSDYFARTIQEKLPGSILWGADAPRAPHIVSLYLPSFDRLWIALDAAGVAVSSGAACRQRQASLSHVLSAMGVFEQQAQQTVRFSFGNYTTKKEIDDLVRRVILVVSKK